MAKDPTIPPSLRERLRADLDAGRTVALSASEMADPAIRAALPTLLAELRALAPGEVPLRVGRYSVLGEIGRGGMSTVHLAHDEELGRDVALKIVRPVGEGKARIRARALREARALARLTHPHIVRVYEVVEQGDLLAIAMEWVDGLTLAGLVKALPPLPGDGDMPALRAALGAAAAAEGPLESTAARTFARMIRDVALAVDRAHELGLLHLDIKPSNVLVQRDGTALLADFGVVREIDVQLTHTQSFAGTPIYAAPEQLRRDDRAFGPRTDVYGLGMTLYELLARARPLADESLGSMLRRIETGRVPRLSTRTGVARDLENIVHKAIAVEPAQRYPTGRALADDLTAWLEGLPVTANPERPLQRLRRWARAEPWKATLIAVLLVLTPVLLALGTTLLAQLPRVIESEMRERRDEAQVQAQSAFMRFLLLGHGAPAGMAQLRAALAHDPDNANLVACLLVQLGLEHWEAAAAEVDRLPPGLRQSAGVRAFAARIAAQEPFFTDAVAADLAGSRLPHDLLLCALDRILRFNDAGYRRHLLVARDALAHLLVVRRDQDHMARGLQAWVAGQLGDERLLHDACLSLETHWPDDDGAKQWRVYAMAGHDRESAHALAVALAAAAPAASRYELGNCAARLLGELGRHGEALRCFESYPPQDDRERRHRELVLPGYVASAGDPMRARELLVDAPPTRSDDYWLWLDVAAQVAPELGRQHFLDLIASGTAPFAALDRACMAAIEQKDGELLLLAAREGRRRYPGFARFRYQLGMPLSNFGELPEAAREFQGLEPPMLDDGTMARFMAHAFHGAGQWDELRRVCELWAARANEENRARIDYYLGMVCARTGRPEAALERFERHIQLGKPRGGDRASAYFERMMLLVAPDSPVATDDPGALLDANYDQLLRRARERGSPWWLAVLAEVQFASGNRGAALRLAELAQKHVDDAAGDDPPDLKSRIAAALVRYGAEAR